MDKFKSFKKFWFMNRERIVDRLVDEDTVTDTSYYILLALNLLLDVKERALFPQDFTED